MADTAQEIVVATEAAPPAQVGMTPMDLLSRALDRGADIAMIEKLMDLQDRHERSTARKAFDAAMAEAKAKIPVIVKNRTVDFEGNSGGRTNYRYEDLASIAETVTPILAEHGLSYRFRTSSPPNEPITVTCIISHRLGHSEENTLQGPRDESGKKNSIQAIGSTLTYLQRMTLKAALGLAAAADDDGKASESNDAPINEEQLATLRSMIDDTNADAAKLCDTLRIDALPDLPASRFKEAEKLLIERKRLIEQRGKKNAGAPK